MFEQAFRNIDDILRKEAGCTTELDYTEQTSWLLFLKFADAFGVSASTLKKWEQGQRFLTGAARTLMNIIEG
jgi:type I restriction enzyme M protein